LARNTNQHVIIDVQGYYYPAEVNVETFRVGTYSDGFVGGSTVSDVVTATCPIGSVMTGGGLWCSSDNFNSSITNWGVINASFPSGNSFIGSCYADALTYSSAKFGPPVTVYAVCLQAASSGVAAIPAQGQPQQGQPSQETLLLLESLRNEAVERESLINSVSP
jgi:hypothetical protein